MSVLEIIKGSVSSPLLPERAREALAGFDTTNITAESIYSLVGAVREAGAIQLAQQLLDVAGIAFDMKSDLRYRLEVANNLIAAEERTSAHELLRELQAKQRDNCHAFRIEAELYAREEEYESALSILCHSPLHDSNLALNEDTIFRAVRLKIYLKAIKSRVQFVPPAKAEPIEGAVVVMMIRDEEDIIGQNLLHHYTLGIRKFVILLNICVDQTESIVRNFQRTHPDAIVCAITDPVQGYYQSSKTQSAFEFSRLYFAAIREDVDWCFVLDADEFIGIDSNLGLADLIKAAERGNKDFISFSLCDACPASGREYQANSNIYSHFDTIVSCAVPVVTKMAFRTAIGPRMAMGNHSIYYKDIHVARGFVAAECGARLVHLPYRSSAQVRTKIMNGGSAYAATSLHESLGGHWRRLYKEYLEHGAAVLEAILHKYNEDTANAARATARFAF
jgi:hypothetical protein